MIRIGSTLILTSLLALTAAGVGAPAFAQDGQVLTTQDEIGGV